MLSPKQDATRCHGLLQIDAQEVLSADRATRKILISFETARNRGRFAGIRGSKLRANLDFFPAARNPGHSAGIRGKITPNLDFFRQHVITDAPPVSAAANYVPNLDFFSGST